jgi:hypothetical protein
MLPALIAVAFAYSAVSQVYCPAELSLVRTVEGGRPARGHALLTVLQYAGQGAALAAAGVLTWKFHAPLALMMSAALCYAVVAGLMRIVAATAGEAVSCRAPEREFFLKGTVAFFRGHPNAVFATGLLAFSELAVRASAVALPFFLSEDLGLDTRASLALLIPGGAGAAFGLLWVARWLEPAATHTAVRLALLGSIVGLFALGAVGGGLTAAQAWVPFSPAAPSNAGTAAAIVVLVPVALLLGLCFAVGPVAARSLLSISAPPDQQSRVFATQGTVTDSLGILPLLLSGLGAQLAGGSATFVFLGIVGAAAFVLLGSMQARRLSAFVPVPVQTSA